MQESPRLNQHLRCHAPWVMAGDAAPIFVLIHSPLVGPGTWTPVARELERRGRQVVVPSLLGAATAPPPQWGYCVDAVRSATGMLSTPIVLVGHSGGGLLLPAITGAVTPEVSRLIFRRFRRAGEYRRNTASATVLPRAFAHARGKRDSAALVELVR